MYEQKRYTYLHICFVCTIYMTTVKQPLIYQIDHFCSRSIAEHNEVTNANSHTSLHAHLHVWPFKYQALFLLRFTYHVEDHCVLGKNSNEWILLRTSLYTFTAHLGRIWPIKMHILACSEKDWSKGIHETSELHVNNTHSSNQ